MKKLIFSCLAAMSAGMSYASVTLPDIMSDNMVLQQKSDASIWGWCTPGAEVSVSPSWDTKSYTARAGKDGRWDVEIATPEASYTPRSIEIVGDGSSIKLDNVLVGEVWLCSGQSNMEMPLKGFWCQPVENAGQADRKSVV